MKLLKKLGWITFIWAGLIVTCGLYYLAFAGLYAAFIK